MALPMTPVPIQPIVVRSGVAGASGLTTRRSRYKSTLATCKEGLYAAAPTAPTTTGGSVVRAGTGSGSTVRWLALGLTMMLGFAACSSGGDDDDARPAAIDDTDTSTSAPEGDVTELEVDRTSRFAKLDTFCEPATEEPAETPEATDDGITEDSISITHIRVTLEDLEDLGFAIPIGDPADQAEKFVGIINDRCGGINGRQLDLSLVEAPPTAPEGQDPNAIAQAACIKATEDNDAVFAFSGSGWGGQGGASCVTGAHDTVYLTTYNVTPEDLAGADNRLYSTTIVARPTASSTSPGRLDEQGALEGKTIGIVMHDSPGDPEIVEQGLHRHARGARPRARARSTRSAAPAATLHHRRDRVGAGHDRRRRRRHVPAPERDQPARRTSPRWSTQGVKPGDVQFYQSAYHAQNGDLVSSKVVAFDDATAGELYNGTVIVSPARHRRVPVARLRAERVRRDVQPRVPGGGRRDVHRRRSRDQLRVRRDHRHVHLHPHHRPGDRGGRPEPDPRRPRGGGRGARRASTAALRIPGSFGPGKYTAPNALYKMTWHYPCPPDRPPFDGESASSPKANAFPIPVLTALTASAIDDDAGDGRPGRARGRGAGRRGEAAGGAGRALRGDDPARRPAAGRRARRRCRCARRCAPAASSMVIVLALITVAEQFERAAGGVLAPDIQDTLNISDTTLIGISAFGGVALVLGAMPLAWLADRMSRVRIVWIATIGWAVATALNGLVVNPFQLFCTRVGIGFGQAYSVPVFASLLTDTYPIQGRARVFALYWMAQPIGLLIGPFLAGVIADTAGGDEGWRWTYIILAIPPVLLAIVAFVAAARAGARPLRAGAGARRGARRRRRREPSCRSRCRPRTQRLKKIKTFYYICTGIGVLGFALVAVPVQLGLLLEDSYGYGAYTRGWMLSLDGGRVARRDPDRRAARTTGSSGTNPVRVVRIAGAFIIGVRLSSWSSRCGCRADRRC